MAYGRSYVNRGPRRSRRTARSTVRGKPKAYKNKSAILTLSKKVNSLKNDIKTVKTPVQYYIEESRTVDSEIETFELVKPNQLVSGGWLRCFSEGTVPPLKERAEFNKLTLNFVMNSDTEPALIDHTVFLVSLYNTNGKKVLDETTNLSIFDENVDMIRMAGLVNLNRGRYNIHKVWRMRTSAQITEGATGLHLYDSQSDHNRKYYKQKVSLKFRNTTGEWDQIQNDDVEYNNRFYLLCFNNNTDSAKNPRFRYSALWSGHTS